VTCRGAVDLGNLINNAEDSQKNEWMDECEFSCHIFVEIKSLFPIFQVYRVNWLKAKARYDRWNEELTLVQHEMFWTVSWFRTQEARWRARADESTKDGHKAYAEKQASMWAEFSAEGLKNFQGKIIVTH
jgi:hypothetical protein